MKLLSLCRKTHKHETPLMSGQALIKTNTSGRSKKLRKTEFRISEFAADKWTVLYRTAWTPNHFYYKFRVIRVRLIMPKLRHSAILYLHYSIVFDISYYHGQSFFFFNLGVCFFLSDGETSTTVLAYPLRGPTVVLNNFNVKLTKSLKQHCYCPRGRS